MFDRYYCIKSMRGSRNFRQGGGGGVQVNLTKKSTDNVFFFFLSSAYFTEVTWFFEENYHFSSFQRGSKIFQGVGGGGGSNCLFPIETHITCDFPGGGGPDPLSPPFWIRTWSHFVTLKLWKTLQKVHFCITIMAR